MNPSEIFSAIVTLTLVMDPLGNLPLFISSLKNVDKQRRKKIIIRELFIALFIMFFFLFFGREFIKLLKLDFISLSIAGGIVLFLIALSMIFPSKYNSINDELSGEPFIVPLAIPLVAGPSVLTMIMLFTIKTQSNLFIWIFVIFISWLINILILSFSEKIAKFLGEKGLLALEKLMGMILITISIQMLLTGIKNFLIS